MKLLAQIKLNSETPLGTTFRFWGTGGNNDNLLESLTDKILVAAIMLSGTFFLIRLVSAGYGYLTSLGDPAKVASSTKEITNAVVGLAIVTTAFFIMQLIESVLNIKILI